MGTGVASARGAIGLRHVLHHYVARLESTNQQRALVPDEWTDPVALAQSISGSAGASFLSESEIHPTDNFLLLEKIFKRLLHLAIEQHVAIDLDCLVFGQVLRLTKRRGFGGKISLHGISEPPIDPLFHRAKIGDFETIVGNPMRIRSDTVLN